MIIYLLLALTFFILYYFIEQKVIKILLIKAARNFTEAFGCSDWLENKDLTSIRKDTDFYRLQNGEMIFKIFEDGKSDLPISDLDYKDLHRFKQIIEAYKNNEPCPHEFFIHKTQKHLIYPYFSNNNSLEIILLATYNNTINDIFDRNKGKN